MSEERTGEQVQESTLRESAIGTPVALARERCSAAGYPLRDRWGYPASDEDVQTVVDFCAEDIPDEDAADRIGIAGALGDIGIAGGYDTLTDEEYEMGIVRAIRQRP